MFLYLSMIDTPEEKTKFEIIYYRYRQLMFHVAFDVLHNTQDAEDVVQSSFLKIAENIEKVDEENEAKTYGFVITITKNKAIDLYRRKNRKKTVPFHEEFVSDVEYSSANEMAGYILQLPEQYQAVLLLKYYHGYSIKEIAKMMELSEANAAKIDQRARAKLQDLMEKEEVL